MTLDECRAHICAGVVYTSHHGTLYDLRLSRDGWAERAELAERELARLQEQAVRVGELEAEIADLKRDAKWETGMGL